MCYEFYLSSKDKEFGKLSKIIKKHNNPRAVVTTNLKTYMKYTLESAYVGNNYFWSMSPNRNDYIVFTFTQPAEIYK